MITQLIIKPVGDKMQEIYFNLPAHLPPLKDLLLKISCNQAIHDLHSRKEIV